MSEQPFIAIVDDDESVREATKGLMMALGFAAEAFSSSKQFLQSERLGAVSCLIADVQMPGMTGVELHEHLMASGRHIPTILITAYPDERIRARVLRSGAICYLSKPFSEATLLDCLHAALDPDPAGETP